MSFFGLLKDNINFVRNFLHRFESQAQAWDFLNVYRSQQFFEI